MLLLQFIAVEQYFWWASTLGCCCWMLRRDAAAATAAQLFNAICMLLLLLVCVVIVARFTIVACLAARARAVFVARWTGIRRGVASESHARTGHLLLHRWQKVGPCVSSVCRCCSCSCSCSPYAVHCCDLYQCPASANKDACIVFTTEVAGKMCVLPNLM